MQQDGAGIRAHGAGEDLDEGALAGAILAEQRMHFARGRAELGVAQRHDATVALRNARRVQQVHAPCLGRPPTRLTIRRLPSR
jgi:hypothetical protein